MVRECDHHDPPVDGFLRDQQDSGGLHGKEINNKGYIFFLQRDETSVMQLPLAMGVAVTISNAETDLV